MYRKKFIFKLSFLSTVFLILIATISFFYKKNHNYYNFKVNGDQPVDYVNPFIGSANGRWFFFTPAALPFGMVKLSPLTNGLGGYRGGGHTTGYRYDDKYIYGFSHIHEWQLGGFLVTPVIKRLDVNTTNWNIANFGSTYYKNSEIGSPGYYSVVLKKGNIKSEMTATKRAGFHRYTFRKSEHANILLDVGHLLGEAGILGTSVENSMIMKVDNRSISGFVSFIPSYAKKPVTIYISGIFSKPFYSYGVYRDNKNYPGQAKISGPRSGFYGTFKTFNGEQIELKVGISYVSQAQAKLNLELEIGESSFDDIAAKAKKEWNDQLRVIEVFGGKESDRVKFYTSLWRVLLGKGIASDANGAYLSSTGAVKQLKTKDGKPLFDIYNTDSMWGAHWNLNQLWSLAFPAHYSSFVNFLLSVYEESGWIPDGYIVNQYAQGMPANYSTAIITTAIMKDMKSFNYSQAYRAIKKNQNVYTDRPHGVQTEGLSSYLKYGFVPNEEKVYGATSATLEYAYQDWCAYQAAKKLGYNEDIVDYKKRSMNFLNVFDNETKMFRPKNKFGIFTQKFDPFSGSSFAEGNAWQYLWYVPQNIESLVNILSKELFITRLEDSFKESSNKKFVAGHGNASGYYSMRINPGNQTDLHASWLFNLVDRPDLTQTYTRKIMNDFYEDTPKKGYGYSQDDDQGQLSAWFVLASIGLFDIQGGCSIDAKFQISTPLFDKIVIRLDKNFYSGQDFVIQVKRESINDYFINSAYLNGKVLKKLEIPQKNIIMGGNLILYLN